MAELPPGSSTLTENKQTKSLTIYAGDTGILKAGVKILAVGVDGNAVAESTCDNLPGPEPYLCYYFQMGVDDLRKTVPMNEESARISQIKIAGKIYEFSGNEANGHSGLVIDWIGLPDGGGACTDSTARDIILGGEDEVSNVGYPSVEISAKIPTSLMQVYRTTSNNVQEGVVKRIYVKMTSAVASSVEMKLEADFFEGLWVRPVQADCPPVSVTSTTTGNVT